MANLTRDFQGALGDPVIKAEFAVHTSSTQFYKLPPQTLRWCETRAWSLPILKHESFAKTAHTSLNQKSVLTVMRGAPVASTLFAIANIQRCCCPKPCTPGTSWGWALTGSDQPTPISTILPTPHARIFAVRTILVHATNFMHFLQEPLYELQHPL